MHEVIESKFHRNKIVKISRTEIVRNLLSIHNKLTSGPAPERPLIRVNQVRLKSKSMIVFVF